ncbi:hypothetical protein [Phycicoccus avicenniae]|uniref:hypothetical protein n=1 Tax=Phycicoccus avicenniae TaxID=2828860 RepID=UPI003D2D7A00
MSTTRAQGAAAGTVLGGVLAVPALFVLAVVTGDLPEAARTWLWVVVPLCALTTALGALAVNGPSSRPRRR